MPLDALGRLYEQAPCGLLTLDRELTVLSANPYFWELAGVGAEGSSDPPSLLALLTVASRIYVQGRLQAQLALGGRVEEIALDIARPDGARVPVMMNAMQERDADGGPGLVHMSILRAVAKRAYEAEAPKARQEAQAAQRVKADFLANVSHEIRTPLNGVVGVVGALQRTDMTPEQREMVALIESSAVTLERLVGDILEISRVEAAALALHLRPFRPIDDLGGVLDLARLSAHAKGLAFEEVRGAGLEHRFLGDAVRLKQILNNLTSNAIKFTERGTVRVLVAVEDTMDSAVLVMTVEDTGIGFDPADAEALFQPFQQADAGISRRFGGVGLGLSICKALVDLMGGAIEATSTPGQGSAFTVRAPLEAITETPEAAPVEAAEMERPLRILLVEDNETNQRVVSMILAEADVDLAMANNGAEGLDAWRASDFDLVLMDMQMPVMDGLTAIRAMRAEEARRPDRPRTPIAVLSANAMDHHRAEAIAAGADIHIAKPISASGLFEGIQTALAAG
ncbi:PAS domain-containing hybrid sensor histidine kinase/response regulator [Caulobacter sp. RL271]|uniref:histidine kinase n=1 Tax=Caulobacter segnis TaxID=88688 RepID=A0ABY4ZY71_9CAUL|nr:PAS domain-containing hybrid sensor histidine kinase/response regulator [Caulobacter segnis]USQ97498.1 ATP-binding protein [Caulobacter segnis]